MDNKHFNLGSVFGQVVADSIERKTSTKSEFVNFQVNVAGRRCGSVRAFCRMWGTERIGEFLDHIADRPRSVFFLKGFYGQFWDERNTVYSTYTIYHFEERDSDPRAAFILRGDVDAIMPVKLGQRMLLNVQREGQDKERLELWLQNEKFLDIPKTGDFVEVKGYLRQEQPEDDFGGSSGKVGAFVEELRIL